VEPMPHAAVAVLCLLALLAGPALADGLIIAKPVPPHHDDAVIEPMPMPRPAPYRFAPLQVDYHHVDVTIKDQVAVTEIDQVFINPSNMRLEGEYIFPVPRGAHIDKFSMDINGKQVEAELLDANKAKQIYTDIVRSMQDPALMEYAGQGLYKVRIFPIEPNSKKHVRLKYTQVLDKDTSLVGYTYPLNTEKFSSAPIKTVKVDVKLECKAPIKNVYSPGHDVTVKRDGEHKATVSYEVRDARPDTDFQVFYSLDAEEDIGLSLLTYRDDAEDDHGYFMLLASPGYIDNPDAVVAKDVVFVLDTSGSMAGEKMKQASKALKFCIYQLNEGDRFEIVRFSTEAEALFGGLVPADSTHQKKAEEFADGLKAIGGTAIESALQHAVEPLVTRAKRDVGRPYVVIFLTDGKPTIGATDEDAILAALEKKLGDHASARVFCFGIGTDINTHLLDKITEKTRAVSQYVLPSEDIEVKVSSFYTKINSPVLSNLQVEVGKGVRLMQLHPPAMPDLFKGDQLVMLGKYEGTGDVAIELTGTVNGKAKKFTYEGTFEAYDTLHSFIPRIWATRRVGHLLEQIRLHGESEELKSEVTYLARRFGIVTPYTAYLIVEDETARPTPGAPALLRGRFDAAADRRELAESYSELKSAKSGEAAVGGSKALGKLKDASGTAAPSEASDDAKLALDLDKLEDEGLERAAQVTANDSEGGWGGEAARKSLVEKRKHGTLNKTIGDTTFYYNGDAWIDQRAVGMKNAEAVEVEFGSDKYFDLFTTLKGKDVAKYLALGKTVTFVHDGKIYKVIEKTEDADKKD